MHGDQRLNACGLTNIHFYRIIQFVLLGPLGMQVSPVVSEGNNLYSANIVWSPKSDQDGNHDVCYYASDSTG